jgi:hypothetical protein
MQNEIKDYSTKGHALAFPRLIYFLLLLENQISLGLYLKRAFLMRAWFDWLPAFSL